MGRRLVKRQQPWTTGMLAGRVLMTLTVTALSLVRLTGTWERNIVGRRVLHGQSVLALNVDDTASRLTQAMRALGYWRTGERTKAIERLRHLSRGTTTRQELWRFQLGTMLLQTGQLVQAVEVYRDMDLMDYVILHCESAIRDRARQSADLWCPPLSHVEVDPRALCAHGDYNRWIGLLGEALQDFQAAEHQGHTLPADCLFGYAKALERLERHEDALVRYRAAFSRKPDHQYLRGAGGVLIKLKDYERAVEVLRQAYDISTSDRDRSESARLLGIVYYNLGTYPTAQIYLQDATSFDGADGSAFLYLARTNRELGQLDAAAEAYRRAVKTVGANRQLIWYRHELAALLSEMGRTSEAAQVYRTILTLEPGDQSAVDSLSELRSQDEP